MRHGIVLGIAKTVAAVVLATASNAVSAGDPSRVERTLEWRGAVAAGSTLRLENLSGSIDVVGGPGAEVRIEARVVAEAEDDAAATELADGVQLVAEGLESGTAVRVAFPIEKHSTLRTPADPDAGVVNRALGWVTPLVRKKSVAVQYDGRTVAIGNERRAPALAVHLRVTLPADVAIDARQVVGALAVSRLRGVARLEVVEGRIDVDQSYGALDVVTLGASVAVRSFRGRTLTVETGSGGVDLSDVQCERLTARTAGGSISARSMETGELRLETASGAIALTDVEPRSFEIVSESGRVDLATHLRRARSGSIRSVSGDVVLRVGEHAPFEIVAESASGALKTRLRSEVVEHDEGRIRWRRGQGGVGLQLTSESGGVEVVPL